MGIAATDWKFHVLVVDDSLFDWKLIERLLQVSGYKALEFLGLRQGIESNDPISSFFISSGSRSEFYHYMIGCDLLKKVKVFVMIHLGL
ncbi:hypothetical protein F2Q70_00032269 [Brassica cretica]|uniref:Response regulatory domain-containing protein n=1 Tax=Brassica cretica TaxID=69181 RepID=A0A8S9FMR4_BRACR|nr:hypothetical protein F2Q70_00032269 [Brassica cretica]